MKKSTSPSQRPKLKFIGVIVLILGALVGIYILLPYAIPLTIFKVTKSGFFEPEQRLVGSGSPHRLSAEDHSLDDKALAEKWEKKCKTASVGEMQALLDATDGWEYWKFIREGVSPWIGILRTDQGTVNHCVAGGLVRVKNSARVGRVEGKIGMSGPILPTMWEVVYRPASISGLSDHSGVTVEKSVLARVPDLNGEHSLKVSGTITTPNSSNEATQEYKLNVIPTPRPDRQTLFSFWGYVLIEGTEADPDGVMPIDYEERMIARYAAAMLIQFEEQFDGELKDLAGELLATSSFRTGVRYLLSD